MTHQMIVRIDPELKAKVSSLAKDEGKSVSEVVRGLLEEYVKTRDIGTYIDDLWDRIGEQLTSSGYSSHDVEDVIREVRDRH